MFAPVRTVRIGTRNNHHIDALQHRLQQALCQFPGNDQQGFATCWFIAMLLADQQHGGSSRGQKCGRIGARAASQHQCLQWLASLRGADLQYSRLDAHRA